MQFWLSYDNFKESLQLPVNPSSFALARGMSNTVITLAELGELNQIGELRLATTKIQSFFPQNYGPYCEYADIPVPEEAVEMIERWEASKKPIRLIVTGTNVNLSVSIENFDWSYQAKTMDIDFNLDLKEYRFVTVKAINDSSSARSSDRATPKTYTVKEGDTLWMIAKQTTGDGENWKTIYSANQTMIGVDPNSILAGQELVISV
jgi:nucleoid-associated protein YgaU